MVKTQGRQGYTTASRYDITIHETYGWDYKYEMSGTSSGIVYGGGYFESASIKAFVYVSGIGSASAEDSLGMSSGNNTYITDVYSCGKSSSYKTDIKGKFFFWRPFYHELTVAAIYNMGPRTYVDQY